MFYPLSLDSISRDLSCMQKRRGRPWRKMGERGVFCRSAENHHPGHPQARLAGKKPPNRATKELLQSFGCQMARVMQVATEERNESSESVSIYDAIVMIIVKRHPPAFLQPQPKAHFPMPNINSS